MCSSKRKATCAVELYLTTKALEIYSGACSMTKHHPRPLGSSSLLPRRDICIGWKHLSPYHVTSYLFVSYHVRFLWFTAFFGVSIYCVYIYIHLYIVQILNLIIHSYHIYIHSYIIHSSYPLICLGGWNPNFSRPHRPSSPRQALGFIAKRRDEIRFVSPTAMCASCICIMYLWSGMWCACVCMCNKNACASRERERGEKN